jgi:hypothetical protein
MKLNATFTPLGGFFNNISRATIEKHLLFDKWKVIEGKETQKHPSCREIALIAHQIFSISPSPLSLLFLSAAPYLITILIFIVIRF